MAGDDMTERSTGTPREQLAQQEPEGRREILDFDKHGAVYGRFLLASLPGADTANIINPDNARLTFDNMVLDALEERDYNPVCTESSIAERKKEWKEVPLFNDAYTQWRTKFTSFMVNIQNPQREKALRAILSNNKEAKEFTVADADTLFNAFCKDTSNIDAFVKSVTNNLTGRSGKINSTYLQELLPHLQWIASGLFGQETASQVVTRLIELESAIHNNPGQVMEIFNSNKERINKPTDDERLLLNALSKGEIPSLIPQEKVPDPAQVAVAVPATRPDVPEPAPVTGEPVIPPSSEGEPSGLAGLDNPPSPPPTENVQQRAERSVEESKPGETEEIGEISRFEDEAMKWQHKNYEISIEKLTNNLSVLFYGKEVDRQLKSVGKYDFDLATAIKDFKGIDPGAAEKIYQALAKSFLNGLEVKNQLFLELLKEFPETSVIEDADRKLLTVSKSLLGDRLIYKVGNTELSYDLIKRLEPKAMSPLNISIGKAVLETWIKNSPTPIAYAESVLRPGETEAAHEPIIEEATIEGNHNIKRLVVNGTDLGYIFVKQSGEGNYTLDSAYNNVNTLKGLDISKGMEVYFDIQPNPSPASRFERISIIGGEGAKLNLKELFSSGILARPVVGIFTTKYNGWKERAALGAERGRGGQAVRHNLDANASFYDIQGLPIGTWMSIDELQNYLKTRKEEIERTGEAKPDLSPGQAGFDSNIPFTGTDRDFLNGLTSLQEKYKK